MRTFISFLGAVLVAFLLFAGGARGLVLTQAIIDGICINTRDNAHCQHLMTKYGVVAGASLEAPFKQVAFMFIERAKVQTTEVHNHGQKLARGARNDPQLHAKYQRCLDKLQEIRGKIDEAKRKAGEGLVQETKAEIDSAVTEAGNLNSLMLSPSDEMRTDIEGLKDSLSIIGAVCTHMPHHQLIA